MLTIEIHGLGREEAEGVRSTLLKILSSLACINRDIDAIGICNMTLLGFDGKPKPQLRLYTNLTHMQNNMIVSKLLDLKLPVHVISTRAYEGN